MRAFLDNLRLSFGTFLGNPLRSLLTLIGIVIGVATVIGAMGMIEGLRVKVNKDLSFFGANVFEIGKWPAVNFGQVDWRKYAQRPNFTYEDVRALMEIPEVTAAGAADYRWGQKVATDREETRPVVSVIGTTSMWNETTSIEVVSGRFFNEADDLDARPVVVLGPDVVDALFPLQDPVGQQVRIRGRNMNVIGVFQRRGSMMGMTSLDNLAVMPMRTMGRVFGQVRAQDIAVKVKEGENFQRAQDSATALMRRRRAVPPNEENNFEVSTNESNTKQLNEFSMLISAAGFGVCLLSLIVGGIGILNIMLVSVTERTREIGVRKALGARKRRILGQFATEAIMLSVFGGLIGIGLGYGIAGLAKWVAGIPAVVPLWAVALSVGMSSVVGLLFGIYPAARAAQLDPVEAMRAE